MHIQKKYLRFLLPFLLLLLAVPAAPSLIDIGKSYRVNHQFEAYTDDLFLTEISKSALNLHYTLAHPENFNITEYSTTLGSFSTASAASHYVTCENKRASLSDFSYEKLNPSNQLTYDILSLAYETELLPGNNYLLEEVLSPSLGSQAQLPVLLAEYTFRKEQDIQDYLKLLASVDTYFEGILTFEEIKSQNGTFMSDVTADRIIEQCSAFIKDPDTNYLKSVFADKISAFPGLSEKKILAYEKLHDKILNEQFLPAYQRLIDGLYLLRGTGKNAGGLCGFTGGRAYYEYLLKSKCGLYEPVSQIQDRLLAQLQLDMEECRSILAQSPELLSSLSGNTARTPSEKNSPEEILPILQNKILKDFPALPDGFTSYKVKYVHKDLEAYLSPAFYLTPPIDTLSPNDIYINGYVGLKGIKLFTTLAHEGFPGHLYQTTFFASTDPPLVRHLLDMGGYVEGWATYIESYAYSYSDELPDLARLEWLDRSLNLCLLSLLDTGIHYDNWDHQKAGEFLMNFGITDADSQEEIYQVIVEDPANYLKYYMGCLHFLDLKESEKKKLGNEFDPRIFHKKILETGPCQFPVLEKYV